MTDGARIDMLRFLCGYVEEGNNGKVSMFQDDATKSWVVTVGGLRCYGSSFREAIDVAINRYMEVHA